MAIEDRVRKLENKVALLVSIADCDAHPFVCACLDAGMDVSQVDIVLSLITRVENALNSDNPFSFAQFEKELHMIVPSQKDNPEFAKVIMRALNRENKFILPSKRFKEEGINI